MQSRPYHTDKNGINFKHKLERDHARPVLRDYEGQTLKETVSGSRMWTMQVIKLFVWKERFHKLRNLCTFDHGLEKNKVTCQPGIQRTLVKKYSVKHFHNGIYSL